MCRFEHFQSQRAFLATRKNLLLKNFALYGAPLSSKTSDYFSSFHFDKTC